MWICVAVFMCLSGLFLSVDEGLDEDRHVEAVMRLAGVTEADELDADEYERLSSLIHAPLSLNQASPAEMERTGLFTPFQIASLVDYRSRHGAVMSLAELSCVDGFNPDLTDRLEPFICLESTSGTKGKGRLRNDLSIRGGGRTDGAYMYGLKYRLMSDGTGLSLSVSRPFGSDVRGPDAFSGNLSWNYGCGRLLLGDFNARFGQGILLWNSTVTGGLTTPSAYMRKSSGLSPTFSFTGSSALTGLAADVAYGPWKASVMLASPGLKEMADTPDKIRLLPAVNIARYFRYGSFSMTHLAEFSDCSGTMFRIPRMGTSADVSMCLAGTNVFAEAVYDWVNRNVAAVAGVELMVTGKMRLAALMKYLPASGFANEYGLAGSLSYSSKAVKGNASIQASYYPESKSKDGSKSLQVKLQTDWDWIFGHGWKLRVRLSERLRTWGARFRTDIRADLSYTSEPIYASSRLNLLRCDGTALLGYLEGGYVRSAFTAYLRVGLFRVDDWDDRIYVYERDSPDSFTVPAFYGRGVWSSAVLSWRPRRWLRLYLRAALTEYPFMDEQKRKPGRAELKLHCVFRL